MIRRLRDAGLLWPSLFVVVALPTLIALGSWQWSRMHWKQGLLADLERSAGAAPVPLSALKGVDMGASPAAWEVLRFRRITVTGTFEHDNEMHVWAPQPSGPAWSVVTPLRLAEGATATRILAIRGVVPSTAKRPSARPSGQVGGAQTVTGRIRIDRPNRWANPPDLQKNEWFTRDLAAMSAHLHARSQGNVDVAPFFLEVERQLGGAGAPQPDLEALVLSNRHFEYALTWWGLAATLAGVFAAFVWGRRSAAAT